MRSDLTAASLTPNWCKTSVKVTFKFWYLEGHLAATQNIRSSEFNTNCFFSRCTPHIVENSQISKVHKTWPRFPAISEWLALIGFCSAPYFFRYWQTRLVPQVLLFVRERFREVLFFLFSGTFVRERFRQVLFFGEEKVTEISNFSGYRLSVGLWGKTIKD